MHLSTKWQLIEIHLRFRVFMNFSVRRYFDFFDFGFWVLVLLRVT